MDSGVEQRLVGAAVLVALGVIFLPKLVTSPAPDSGVSGLEFQLPDVPEGMEGGSVTTLPLDETAAKIVAPADAVNEVQDTPSIAVPPEHAPQEPALPAVAANGAYVVHFAAFATQADADLTVRHLQDHGLAAFSENTNVQGRPAVRVRIGPYQTQTEAEIVRVKAAQVRSDVQPRVFMLLDQAAAERTAAALQQAPTAPPALAAAEVGFVIQLGAFRDAEKADSLQKRLHQAGITAFTDTISTSTHGTLTRVNAGPVSSRAEARRLKDRVKSLVGVEGVVHAHP